jgi:hypothetical protein
MLDLGGLSVKSSGPGRHLASALAGRILTPVPSHLSFVPIIATSAAQRDMAAGRVTSRVTSIANTRETAMRSLTASRF